MLVTASCMCVPLREVGLRLRLEGARRDVGWKARYPDRQRPIDIDGSEPVKRGHVMQITSEHALRIGRGARTHGPMADDAPKRLVVVGDRVLITPEQGEERTNVGLYLPATAVEGRQVQGGRIMATGPGSPMSEPASMDEEPWKIRTPEIRYLPMQAEVGD